MNWVSGNIKNFYGEIVDLNEKQKMFCHEYILDFNASKAAARAGYKPSYGPSLLAKEEISSYLTEMINDKKSSIAADEKKIIRELSAIAFSKLSDYIKIEHHDNEKTNLKKPYLKLTDTSELTAEQLSAIDEIKETSQGIVLKLYDKTKALELIGKHIGMFIPRAESGDLELNVTIDYGDMEEGDISNG